MKILVLGGGNVGRAVVADLSEIHEIWVGDREPVDVQGAAGKIELDASNHQTLKEEITHMDMVICALPSFLGYGILRTCIDAGTDVVDVSFSPKDPLPLDKAAKEAGVTVAVDAGFGPGLSNLFVGNISRELDSISECYIKIGGLPKYPKPPLYYESTWCTRDLIEEYTRDARIISERKITRKKPLESIGVAEVMGYQLEEFYSDGLRTLLHTVDAEIMEETTLRWPGHLDKVKVLDELGFFNEEHVDDTIEIIAPLMKNSGNDISMMTVVARGPIDGVDHTIYYELYDEARDGLSSMSRTTGFTTAAVARLVCDGRIPNGIMPLEFIGKDADMHDYIIHRLTDLGITINRKIFRNRDLR